MIEKNRKLEERLHIQELDVTNDITIAQLEITQVRSKYLVTEEECSQLRNENLALVRKINEQAARLEELEQFKARCRQLQKDTQ